MPISPSPTRRQMHQLQAVATISMPPRQRNSPNRPPCMLPICPRMRAWRSRITPLSLLHPPPSGASHGEPMLCAALELDWPACYVLCMSAVRSPLPLRTCIALCKLDVNLHQTFSRMNSMLLTYIMLQHRGENQVILVYQCKVRIILDVC